MFICPWIGGFQSHSLRGLCGLKFPGLDSFETVESSQPARAVWIEILVGLRDLWNLRLSQPARAVWIEIIIILNLAHNSLSQPARAVWIEILELKR